MRGVTMLLLMTLAFYDGINGDDCPIQGTNKCKCFNRVVDCTNQGFTNVPTFTPVGWDQFDLVKLSYNSIRNIPSNAFRNINVTTIELDHNDIDSIAVDAFSGISNYLTSLNLEGNLLSNASAAFGNLPHLTSLNILNNPVREVSDPVLFALGATLLDFAFGDADLPFWPTTLNHLQTLKSLRFEGKAMNNIPFNAFHGFELTLTKLTIRGTSVTSVPLAVKELLYLEEFYFEDNIYVRDSGLLESAFRTSQGASPIKTLSLKNNSLTTFPTALRQFPNLETFYMDRNRLWYINDAMVSNVRGYMYNISLKDCSLDRIPQAILRIVYLRKLDLSDNNINSIYSNDFTFNNESRHDHLMILNLANNPLRYIASTSFNNLVKLEELNITSTVLPALPRALGNVPSLRKVYVTNTPVECTCDLKWIPTTNAAHVTFEGDCDTITQSIENYISIRVPHCP